MVLPTPPAADPDAAVAWVRAHLADLVAGEVTASGRFRGGQSAADAALAGLDVRGYARRRSQVWPPSSRGASGLSPYIRHGLLGLPRVWSAAGDGPHRDVERFREELLWQEYARHVYARVGGAVSRHLRARGPVATGGDPDRVWDRRMACMAACREELARDGWLVNQARMWLASHWSVRHGHDLRDGERAMFREFLDGSRAANALGWQWTAGTATERPYGFSRRQVERRAPALCRRCALRDACPVEDWPEPPPPERIPPPDGLRADLDPARTAGPSRPDVAAAPDVVRITAESLGDADPALAAHPHVPAAFVFDEAVLARLRLAGRRLVFLAETLADLATRRPVEVHRGDPVAVLSGRAVAATFTPVPGRRRRARAIRPVAVHPWPWLCPPHGGSAASFTAWRRRARPPGAAD